MIQRRNPTGRWLLAVGAAALGVALACSHQERYGRDPHELHSSPPPRDTQIIARARAKQTAEANDPGTAAIDDETLTPAPVMFVNTEAITVEDILKWLRPDLESLAQTEKPEEYMRDLVELTSEAIRRRVENELLYQVAVRRMTETELEKVDSIVDGRIREIVTEEHAGRQSRYEQWLKERGLTFADDRERIRRETIVTIHLQRTINEHLSEPTRRELENAYKEYLADLKQEQKRHMQLIEIPIGRQDAGGNPLRPAISRGQAQARIHAAKNALELGEDFAAVAKEHSLGINAFNGGDWGKIGREGVRDRWAKAVEALYRLREGGVSEVIETDDAFFLVKCADVERTEPRTFGEVQTELIERYRRRQFDLRARELVAEQYEDAVIRPENPGRFLRAVVESAPRPGGAEPVLSSK